MNKQLKIACIKGDIRTVKNLVKDGLDFNIDNNNYAVIFAAEHGKLDLLKYMAGKGADLSFRDKAAAIGAAKSGHLKVLEYLASKGCRLTKAEDVRCAVYLATENGKIDLVKGFLDAITQKFLSDKALAIDIWGYNN